MFCNTYEFGPHPFQDSAWPALDHLASGLMEKIKNDFSTPKNTALKLTYSNKLLTHYAKGTP